MAREPHYAGALSAARNVAFLGPELMPNPAAGDLFNGNLMPSLAGAAWAWALALLIGAALLPLKDELHARARILVWGVVGVAVQSQGWLLLACLGRLWPAAVLITAVLLTVACALAGGPRLMRELRACSVADSTDSVVASSEDRWLRVAAWGAVAVFLLLVLRLAVWPTVFYDDLVYHVGVPRQALLTGSWPAMPGLHYSFMPAGWDALYVLPLALGGGSGPQLMNVIALALFAWAVYRLARLGAGPAPAAVATALLIIAPVTGSLGALAGNDLFVGLALCVAAERLIVTSGTRPWLIGLLAGAAWGAKYSALPACVGLGLAAALLHDADWHRRLRTLAVVGAVTVAVPLGWTLRTLWLTGNPVYPAFFGLFGGRYWNAESAAAVAEQVSHGGLENRGPAAFALALRDLIFRSDSLGYPSGAAVLFVLLGLAGLLLLHRVRGGTALLVVWIVGYAGWCVTSLNLRYALILLALLAPFAAQLIETALRRMRGAIPARVLGPAAAALLLLAVAGPFATTAQRHLRLYGPGSPLFGGTARGEIHTTRLHLGAAGRAMAERLPADARILLVGEGRVGLLPRPALASSAYDMPDIARFVDGASSVGELNRRLEGFTHVVVNYRELERFRRDYGFAERFEPEGWRLFESWLEQGLHPLGRYGNVVIYQIPSEVAA